MSDDVLHDLLSQGLSNEEIARALLDLTLQAAPPDLADAIRVYAIPAWFDPGHLAFLADQGQEEAAALLEQVAAFSFVLPREGGGYVYHEATRARLLDWWREPDNRPRFAELSERLAYPYLALAREQRPRLSGPDYLGALTVMDAAYPNVRAAWEGVVETENYEIVRGFAYALADYQGRRGLWGEKLASAREGLTACECLDDQTGQADMQIILGNAYSDLPTGDRAANLEKAIECYREALRFRTPEAAPLDYAMTQNNLGNAYWDLPTGDRAANLAKAIECYREALRVYTPEAAPLYYAVTQNNLGNAYADLPTGDRAANLAKAIECYQEGLRFRTPEAAPLDYAMTQNNLGTAYLRLPTGDRAANLAKAIECYREALRFRTPEAAPLDYAMTQNNLGNAYADLPTGDRVANLEKAIECYREALRVYTPEAAPLDYAMTQNNLGTAYSDLPTGDRAANLEKAIECYREAVRVYTPEAAPLDYAMTQNNLGTAYSDLPTGDRAANLAKAIDCYQEALRVYTPEAAPLDYGVTQDNLGMAYLHLPTGDRVTNLNQALEHAETALQINGLSSWNQATYLFTRGLIHLALGHQDQALADHQAAIPLADSITIAEALKDLNEFAADHPDTPGLDTLRALFPSPL